MENQSQDVSSLAEVCEEELNRSKTGDTVVNKEEFYRDQPFSMKILVVEAESIVAADIQDMLREWGFLVPAVVSSGEKAVEKSAETYPDLVLMATELKGDMDGIEAAEQIRARFDIPVVYLTTQANGNTFQWAGHYSCIQKPFDERKLYTTLEEALYKHNRNRHQLSHRWQI